MAVEFPPKTRATRKKPDPAKPAPVRKAPPAAPQTERMGPVEFDRAIERLIRLAEKAAGEDWNEWAQVALHLERARTPLRAVMTKAERGRL